MSAPKSILKKPKIDSGSSKTRLSGSKGKATLSLPQKAIPSQLVKPGPASDEMDDDEEEDDEGFGGLDDGADEDEEMDTDEEIEVGSVSSSGRGKVGNSESGLRIVHVGLLCGTASGGERAESLVLACLRGVRMFRRPPTR